MHTSSGAIPPDCFAMTCGSLASEPGFKRLKPSPYSLNHFYTLLRSAVRSVVWCCKKRSTHSENMHQRQLYPNTSQLSTSMTEERRLDGKLSSAQTSRHHPTTAQHPLCHGPSCLQKIRQHPPKPPRFFPRTTQHSEWRRDWQKEGLARNRTGVAGRY